MSMRVVLMVSAGDAPEWWRPEWGTLRLITPEALADGGSAEADVAIVVATSADPFAAVRTLHERDPAVQPVLLVPPGERARLERALLFAPGIGELWVRETLDATLLDQATSITRQRRSFRQVQAQLPELRPRPHALPEFASDAYLAALLQVLPDPAAAIDEQGRVLYWSPAAEQRFGVASARARGQPFDRLVPMQTELRPLLEQSQEAELRTEIRYHTGSAGDGDRVAVLALAPVRLDGQRLRAALLHDVTEERRIQDQLGMQAEELAQQATELEQQAAELEQIAAEREELLHEREHTLRELRHAMEVRTRFYASMNHEIRTPLNAIMGYTDLLLSGVYGTLPEPQQHALGQSHRAAQHLLEIINDLLDLSKLEAGRIELQLAPVELPALFDELLATVRPVAAEHGSPIEVEPLHCTGAIVTDPRRVRQVLLNLLSNAAKFGEGKPITLRCEPLEPDGIAIEVEDRGVGIAPEDMNAIFEEFVQVGVAHQGGTGLGLPISRRLAELLGGRLTARSAVGEGSTFRLELPPRTPLQGAAGTG